MVVFHDEERDAIYASEVMGKPVYSNFLLFVHVATMCTNFIMAASGIE